MKQVAELQSLLGSLLPFSVPIDTNITNVKSIRKVGFTQGSSQADLKRPAWKPYLFRGKQKIDISLREEVSASQYDNPSISDTWQANGIISVKAEVEGLPEITLGLSWNHKSNAVGRIVLDPHAQGADIMVTKKICFAPPLGQFVLATYSLASLQKLPLRGFLQMKRVDSSQIKLLAQLKLDDSIPKEFEYCEARIPFPNRGRIQSIQASPTTGSVRVDEHQTLVWDIGQRVSSKNLELALPATVIFEPETQSPGDPFLVDLNCYIEVRFKLLDHCLSGMQVDPRNTIFYPQVKVHLNVSREVVSGTYLIWNSLGASRHALDI